ncbi:MAG: aminoglycoside 3'-phosphotransferase [Oligoflexia bacterium]|nr:aminoglycoside 3'-phosphotransferase [Oligoflexia bacterium]
MLSSSHLCDLPEPLRQYLLVYRLESIAIGRSSATVYRCTHLSQPSLFLKIVKVEDENSSVLLSTERKKLEWLSRRIIVPRVVEFAQAAEVQYLLISALLGQDAGQVSSPAEAQAKPPEIVSSVKGLHGVSPDECPFDEGIETRLARVEVRLRDGKVNTSNFSSKWRGKSLTDLFSHLVKCKPKVEDVVVAHGDCCLPNIILNPQGSSGLIDLGRVGRADRYQALAILSGSLAAEYNPFYGAARTQRMFALYGIDTPDQAKIDYFQLLEEFF